MKKYTFKDFIEMNIGVQFDTGEEAREFLYECIKKKVVDAAGATELFKWPLSMVYCFNYGGCGMLTVGTLPPRWKQINYKDFIFDDSVKEIHITVKGNQTHATLKENDKVIKHEVAKCHPDDEFDFRVGAKLAFDRLFDKERVIEDYEEEHKLLNCSFEVLSNNSRYLTAGKVYDVVNGVFVADNKGSYPVWAAPLTSFEKLECYLDPNKKPSDHYFAETAIQIKPINKVQRKAKVGEYIMIDNSVTPNKNYDNHDIGIVKGVRFNKFGVYNLALINGVNQATAPKEYVVLEGYVPIKKTKKVLAVKSNDDYIATESNVLGTPVLMKDVKGNQLHIGDVVKVFDRNNELFKTSIVTKHKNGIVCPNSMSYLIWNSNGISNGRHWCVLDKSYDNLKVGDIFINTLSSCVIEEIEVEDNG